MMKKYFLAFIQVFFFIFCKSQSTFNLKGYINNEKVNKLYFIYYDDIKKEGVNDSVEVAKGVFTFKGQISHAALLVIKLNRGREIDSNTIFTFVDPNNIDIQINYTPFHVENMKGSPTYLEYDSLNKQKENIHKKFESIYNYFVSEKDKNKKDSLNILLSPYYDNIERLDYSFFITHPNSFVTGFLLQRYYRKFSTDTLEMLYNNMNDTLQKSIYGNQLKEIIQQKSIRKKTICIGCEAPNFQATTIDNKKIELNEFKGKYVILDFWASWCIPCREAFSELKKIYAKYNRKELAIIAVTIDEDLQAWRNAIQQDGIGQWYHTTATKQPKVKTEDDIIEKYETNGIPTQYLIDKNGKIIGRWFGYTEANEKELRKLIGENLK